MIPQLNCPFIFKNTPAFPFREYCKHAFFFQLQTWSPTNNPLSTTILLLHSHPTRSTKLVPTPAARRTTSSSSPLYPRRRRRHTCPINHALICLASLLLFLLALFFLYPSDPDLTIVRIKLNHIKLHTIPHFSLDISMDTTVRVRNRDYYSLDYDSLVVSIGYRGETLGLVKSDGGVMKARGSSYVNATVVLDGIQIFSDVIYLIEDFAKGTIPFDTLTEVSGTVGLLFFHIPIKAKVSCEVSVDTTNQTITRQDCYPQ